VFDDNHQTIGDYPGAGTEEILSAHLSERQLKSWIIDLDRR